MTAYTWRPIEDLPPDWPELASSEFAGLLGVWNEHRARLEQRAGVQAFHERLRREWAIETGIIENLYSIDRGTTVLLIEKGLEAGLLTHGSTDKPPLQVIALLQDQHSALEGLFAFINQQRPLSTSYIKELHAELTRHQPTVTAYDQFEQAHEVVLLRGAYKNTPNNPTRPDALLHEYCPPEHVPAEMDRLVALHLRHQEIGVPPEVEAAWLHHRFTPIHPFQDGNGRVARLLATLVFLRAHGFPLIIDRDQRDRYLTALETADQGNLTPLVALCVEVQKASLNQALSLSDDVLTDRDPLRQMMTAIQERLQAKQPPDVHARSAFGISREIEKLTYSRLETVSTELVMALRSAGVMDRVDVDASDIISGNQDRYDAEVIEIARQSTYYADIGTYRHWVALTVHGRRRVELVVSFHALGFEFTGVFAVSAFLVYRNPGDIGTPVLDGPYRVCDEVFQFAYTEDEAKVIERFGGWLERAILTGLDQWRRSL